MASRLADLLDQAAVPRLVEPSASPVDDPTLDEVGTHLRKLRRDRLVELLLEHAREDERLAKRLRLLALRAASGPVDVGAYRSLIDRAIVVDGFVRPPQTGAYLAGLRDTIDALDALVADENAAEAVELTEHALGALESAIERVDGADEDMSEAADRLVTLHRAACELARPDATELAERLFTWELRGEHDIFESAVARYADVLGPDGVARYRALADERWESVPALRPGDPEPDAERLRITRMMEALAGLSDMVEHLVAVRAQDLSRANRFLGIAELYRKRGNADAALDWVERGLRDFDRPDPRLRAFAAEEYRRRGRKDDALEQAWLAFRDRPALDTYRQLKEDAEAADDWPKRREAALGALANGTGPSWLPARDGSEAVEILLWDGDDDAAWQHAVRHGCADDQWLELATRRRADHPRDALQAYERLLESVIADRSKDSYRDVTALLDEIRGVLEDLGQQDTFSRYVERLRDAGKRKRSLVKLFE